MLEDVIQSTVIHDIEIPYRNIEQFINEIRKRNRSWVTVFLKIRVTVRRR